MHQLAVLMTVFNRVDKTLSCLEKLFSSTGIDKTFRLKVFLVDDGSTDGSWDKISASYPAVHLIKGSGNLYWNRGMYTAWQSAALFSNFDAFVWLNNDTMLLQNGIQTLIDGAVKTSWKSIICGSIQSSENPEVLTYGGCLTNQDGYSINYPNGSLQPCHIINGNCVLIPEHVFLKVGMLDYKFTHAIGDNDYSLRAMKKGIKSYSTEFVASCEKNEQMPAWCHPSKPILTRIKNLYHPLGRNEPVNFFRFKFRHYGFLPAVKSFISLHLRVLFPAIWIKYR
ncbi:MAG: glycosyltransferase family 2 protein [Flavitalea sp.]